MPRFYPLYPLVASALTAFLLALTAVSAKADGHMADPAATMQAILGQMGIDAATLEVPDPEGPLLVSIDFETTLPAEAFAAEMEAGAPFIAEAPGLIWKVWGYDEETGRATGSYLFASQAAVDVYVNGIFQMGPPTREGYANFDILVTRVMEAPSRATDAPLD